MSVFASPRFLPRVLLADAASSVATGVAQLAFTDTLSRTLALPAALLTATGLFMLAYGALAAWLATRQPVPRPAVWLIVIGNFGWAAGCVALLASGLVAPTALGTAWVLAQAAAVVVLAELQWMGLRRADAPGWA